MEDTTDFLRRNPLGHTEFLIDRARAGSDTAWKEILRRYRTMLLYHFRSQVPGFARRHLDEDDLLQTVFSKAWTHIRAFEYRGEGSFRRWLAKLIVNECMNEVKAKRTEGSLENLELTEMVDEAGAERKELSEERARLIEKLGELAEEDRDILIMRYFEGMSWDAMGEVLECSREKAQGHYEQALERLARRLGLE